ncbi:hypothetical protein CP98_03178 [Sphingobium yanoikuyae]|uniref:Uncharacterized protein n=1 Tax=Sphingobium yanoikuyae TaxID=13690 RepID=A0A084EIA3_SPHYA|nr:hypothetical protein [Sphingobium yanoikuyae]KEZ17695.1 hypothetical protein CP98_03178 [Sphingobium yanoikuyae]
MSENAHSSDVDKTAISSLANRFADMSAYEIATMVVSEREAWSDARQQAEHRAADIVRANAQIADLKADLRRVQSDLADREREARNAREATDQARMAAAELRGRLKEVRANQMVRRGDLVGFGEVGAPRFDPYDDGVPF